MKKLLSIILTVVLVACLFTACGAAEEAKVTGMYLSPAKLSYQNMRPTYNYYLTTFAHQELTILDDNTYCLIVSESTFSALELAESTNDAKGNERTNSITKYYGTYTSQVNELDEDLLDITISAPTRVVKTYDQTYWLDTDNWTDQMGKLVVPATGYDQTTGAPIYDENAEPWTAEQYLKSMAFSEVTIQANQKTFSFDFTELVFPE
ncbi:MAG: hypothetical protein IJN67_14660 [Oscillospiraceae bacterium]|nr:hypothetical protein [Oscillospiraceae bacterium]